MQACDRTSCTGLLICEHAAQLAGGRQSCMPPTETEAMLHMTDIALLAAESGVQTRCDAAFVVRLCSRCSHEGSLAPSHLRKLLELCDTAARPPRAVQSFAAMMPDYSTTWPPTPKYASLNQACKMTCMHAFKALQDIVQLHVQNNSCTSHDLGSLLSYCNIMLCRCNLTKTGIRA